MQIELIRIQENRHSYEGLLLIDGLKMCDTTENRTHCLAPGCYPIVIRHCSLVHAKVPLIGSPRPSDRPLERIILPQPGRPQKDFAAPPMLPTSQCCMDCMAAAAKRESICHDEMCRLEIAIKEGMHGQALVRYERQLDARRRHALLQHPPHACPRFRHGHGIFGLPDGSILLGTYLVPGVLLHSRDTYRQVLANLLRAPSLTLLVTPVRR